MPSIAQQDYIFIPILDGGEIPEEIPQEIQNRLIRIAEAGNGLDVVFTNDELSGGYKYFYRPISVTSDTIYASFMVYEYPNSELKTIACNYREITDEPDAQEEH